MKTLLVGIVLGVAAKLLWDSEYGRDLRDTVNDWWEDILEGVDQKIVRAEAAVEKVAGKVDDTIN